MKSDTALLKLCFVVLFIPGCSCKHEELREARNHPDIQIVDATSIRLMGAATLFYACNERWPESMESLKAFGHRDTGEAIGEGVRQLLGAIDWSSIYNLTFQTQDNGSLRIQYSIKSQLDGISRAEERAVTVFPPDASEAGSD